MMVVAFGDDLDLPIEHVDEVTGLPHENIGIHEVAETAGSVMASFSSSDALKYLQSKYGSLFV